MNVNQTWLFALTHQHVDGFLGGQYFLGEGPDRRQAGSV